MTYEYNIKCCPDLICIVSSLYLILSHYKIYIFVSSSFDVQLYFPFLLTVILLYYTKSVS